MNSKLIAFFMLFSCVGLASSVHISAPEKGASFIDAQAISVVSVIVNDSTGLSSCTSYLNNVLIKNYVLVDNTTTGFQDSITMTEGINTYNVNCTSACQGVNCTGGSTFTDSSLFSFKPEPNWVFIGTIIAMIVVIVWVFGKGGFN